MSSFLPPPRPAGSLPRHRRGHTVSFTIDGAEGYLTTGTFPGGRLGEIEVRMAKQGSTLAGVLDALSAAVSVGLQAGAPLSDYVDELRQLRFDPAGKTQGHEVRVRRPVSRRSSRSCIWLGPSWSGVLGGPIATSARRSC